MPIDTAALKGQYRMPDVVTNTLGAPERSGRPAMFLCPFHRESTASFAVYEDHAHCFGCGWHGDVIKFVMDMEGLDFMGAVRRIDSGYVPTPKEGNAGWSAPKASKHPPITVTLEQVAQYASDQRNVEQFARSRAIGRSIYPNMWGEVVEKSYYKTLKGEWLEFPVRYYTIPYWSGRTPKCMNKRRDDAYCLKKIDELSAKVDLVREDLLARKRFLSASDITDRYLLDTVFGRKYKKSVGFQAGMYNSNEVYVLDEHGNIVFDETGKPVPRKLDLVFITEGEIDAQSLHDHGYRAVAAKPSQKWNFNHPFSQTAMVLVVADNDRAGVEFAHKLSAQIVKAPTRVIMPFQDYKDINELILDGQLERWIDHQRLFATHPSCLF